MVRKRKFRATVEAIMLLPKPTTSEMITPSWFLMEFNANCTASVWYFKSEYVPSVISLGVSMFSSVVILKYSCNTRINIAYGE